MALAYESHDMMHLRLPSAHRPQVASPVAAYEFLNPIVNSTTTLNSAAKNWEALHLSLLRWMQNEG